MGSENQQLTTRERLLDAAERLYADQGIDGTSLRAITAEADANLAAVHYHFGSKEALTEEVFKRRLLPLNQERLRLLDVLQAEAGDEAVALEAILEALIGPALKMTREPGRGGEHFIRLMGRIYSDPGLYQEKLIPQQFGAVFQRFTTALSKALPHLTRQELLWRFYFLLGAMIHTTSDPAKLKRLSEGICDPSDTEAVITHLVTFLAAGLRAPPPIPGNIAEEVPGKTGGGGRT